MGKYDKICYCISSVQVVLNYTAIERMIPWALLGV